MVYIVLVLVYVVVLVCPHILYTGKEKENMQVYSIDLVIALLVLILGIMSICYIKDWLDEVYK